ADGEEHTIVLRRAVVVTGNVTDAKTSEPVGSFKVIPGYFQRYGSEETVPIWDRSERRFGTNGFYELVLTEENVPKLRIEAAGYETAEAQPQLSNALETTCDFQLRLIDTNRFIRGTVLLPDGSRATGVEVALCTYQCGVMLEGTTFQKRLFGNAIREPVEDYR